MAFYQKPRTQSYRSSSQVVSSEERRFKEVVYLYSKILLTVRKRKVLLLNRSTITLILHQQSKFLRHMRQFICLSGCSHKMQFRSKSKVLKRRTKRSHNTKTLSIPSNQSKRRLRKTRIKLIGPNLTVLIIASITLEQRVMKKWNTILREKKATLMKMSICRIILVATYLKAREMIRLQEKVLYYKNKFHKLLVSNQSHQNSLNRSLVVALSSQCLR